MAIYTPIRNEGTRGKIVTQIISAGCRLFNYGFSYFSKDYLRLFLGCCLVLYAIIAGKRVKWQCIKFFLIKIEMKDNPNSFISKRGERGELLIAKESALSGNEWLGGRWCHNIDPQKIIEKPLPPPGVEREGMSSVYDPLKNFLPWISKVLSLFLMGNTKMKWQRENEVTSKSRKCLQN